nr:MAG TPA: hypothetical protein [Caudoviricetes sp.]
MSKKINCGNALTKRQHRDNIQMRKRNGWR